jgi:hypothetical protein
MQGAATRAHLPVQCIRIIIDACSARSRTASGQSITSLATAITLDEVREAVLQRPYWLRNGRSGSVLCYGTTSAGKHLLVVLVEDRPGVAFVVTAREMTGPEKKTFHRKAR